MPRLPVLSGQDVVKAPQQLGFVFVRQRGGHLIMQRGSIGCVVPLHREVKKGTLATIIRQAGITTDELIAAAGFRSGPPPTQ